jgi:alpha-glucosidase
MRDAVRLRYALIPYIYTMSRKTYDTGISLCRPMYYDYPEEAEAYQFPGQYQFGDNLIIAPVTSPIDSASLLATVSVWLPPGEWVEWFTGARLRGPAVYERKFAVDEIPVYARAGAIVPMQPVNANAGQQLANPLVITLFPGAESRFALYEDAGNSTAYQKGEFCKTAIEWQGGESSTRTLRINPVEGSYPGMLTERQYEIHVAGVMPPGSALCNGRPLGQTRETEGEGWSYDGTKGELCLRTAAFSTSAPVEVVLEGMRDLPQVLQNLRGTLARLHRVMPLLNNLWPREWSPEILVSAAETGNRMSIAPADADKELKGLTAALPKVKEEIAALKIDALLKARVLEHLGKIDK